MHRRRWQRGRPYGLTRRLSRWEAKARALLRTGGRSSAGAITARASLGMERWRARWCRCPWSGERTGGRRTGASGCRCSGHQAMKRPRLRPQRCTRPNWPASRSLLVHALLRRAAGNRIARSRFKPAPGGPRIRCTPIAWRRKVLFLVLGRPTGRARQRHGCRPPVHCPTVFGAARDLGKSATFPQGRRRSPIAIWALEPPPRCHRSSRGSSGKRPSSPRAAKKAPRGRGG